MDSAGYQSDVDDHCSALLVLVIGLDVTRDNAHNFIILDCLHLMFINLLLADELLDAVFLFNVIGRDGVRNLKF